MVVAFFVECHLEKKDRARLYGLELKSPLVLKLAVKVFMVYSCYKDKSVVVMAVTHALTVVMLK